LEGKIKNLIDMFNKFDILYKSKDVILDLLDYMQSIICNYIIENKEYGQKYLKLPSNVEEAKAKLKSNNNYDMCIDNLLMSLLENN
jgi:hypothetical protein